MLVNSSFRIGEWVLRVMVSPNRIQGSHFLPLARQGTLANLTFDEVQTQMGNVGKTLNCMNLDELFKNVISAEGHHDQLMQKPSSSSSLAPSSLFVGNVDLNGTLSKKKVNEVWKEIVLHEHLNGANASNTQSVSIQQQLGETALEDFLPRAGLINAGNQDNVINPQPLLAMNPMAVMSQQADWLQLQMAAVERQQQQNQQQMTTLHSNCHVSENVFEKPVMDFTYTENQMAMSTPMAAVAAATSPDHLAAVEKKRQFSGEVMDKTMERRQKRMLKNRESAARSRARKQVWLFELIIYSVS